MVTKRTGYEVDISGLRAFAESLISSMIARTSRSVFATRRL